MLRTAAILALGAMSALAQGSLTLVQDGTPNASIVVAPNAPNTVTRAATELRNTIKRSTGAELPILVGERPTAGHSVFLGESAFTRELGISVQGVKPDGYRWQTGPDWLVIVGRDHGGGVVHGMRNPWNPHEVYNHELKLGAFGEAGTLYGAYHFLERFLGVRWYMPGDLGTVIPRHRSVSIPFLNVTQEPDFEYRYSWF